MGWAICARRSTGRPTQPSPRTPSGGGHAHGRGGPDGKGGGGPAGPRQVSMTTGHYFGPRKRSTGAARVLEALSHRPPRDEKGGTAAGPRTCRSPELGEGAPSG